MNVGMDELPTNGGVETGRKGVEGGIKRWHLPAISIGNLGRFKVAANIGALSVEVNRVDAHLASNCAPPELPATSLLSRIS